MFIFLNNFYLIKVLISKKQFDISINYPKISLYLKMKLILSFKYQNIILND